MEIGETERNGIDAAAIRASPGVQKTVKGPSFLCAANNVLPLTAVPHPSATTGIEQGLLSPRSRVSVAGKRQHEQAPTVRFRVHD